ncbi:MAG: hypothetical protein ACI86M_002839 [Saprospiraceae bacterium]|jgi:hypothetical protein
MAQATLVSMLSYMIFDTLVIFAPLVYFVIFLFVFKIFKENNNDVGDSLF